MENIKLKTVVISTKSKTQQGQTNRSVTHVSTLFSYQLVSLVVSPAHNGLRPCPIQDAPHPHRPCPVGLKKA